MAPDKIVNKSSTQKASNDYFVGIEMMMIDKIVIEKCQDVFPSKGLSRHDYW